MPWPNQHKHLTPIAGTLSDPCLFFSDLLVTSGPATQGSQFAIPPCLPINFVTTPPYRCVYGFWPGFGFGWLYQDTPNTTLFVTLNCAQPITARGTLVRFFDTSTPPNRAAGYGGLVDYLTGGTVYPATGDTCVLPLFIDIELG